MKRITACICLIICICILYHLGIIIKNHMSSQFGFIDIILLAMFAGFIILRLRNILGKKTGHQGKPMKIFPPKGMEALKDVQPKVSRNLAMLRKNGLLVDRRQGQWVFYRINPALPAWAKTVISETTESNVGFIQENIQNLCLMGSRPDKAKTYC